MKRSGLRALAVLVLAALVDGCASATPDVTRTASPVPAVTASPVPTVLTLPPPSATAVPRPAPTVNIAPPMSAGPLPGIGVLVVRDALGTLYRYDGDSGGIEKLTTLSTWSLLARAETGVYEVGAHGGVIFVPWSGAPRDVACDGFALSISRAGSCVARVNGPDGGLVVRAAGGATPTLLLPTDWGAAAPTSWDPTARRLAVARIVDQRCMRCPNALYVIEPDGTPRLLLDTRTAPTDLGSICGVAWAPDGHVMALSFCHGAAGLDAHVGSAFALLNVETGKVTRSLGVTPGLPGDIAWSPHGLLAYVSGTFDQLSSASLDVLLPDGRVRVLDTGTRPAWDASGDRLGWVRADGTAAILDLRTDSRSEVRCGSGTVAGVQFSVDPDALLVLCRLPIVGLDRYELRYRTPGHDELVLEGLGGTLSYPPGLNFADSIVWSGGVVR